ncbi:hypothetical protein L596_015257 [Steinernema carpocapsae]|uniref:Uncharacterized protein n=1 Tax=Steinernema carpocapsae TaxID=34508 RepID=A0A4U5NFE0_STECR|nr:hypothetical protein L596_015257 [Steinernema carpocapsae]
MAPYLCRSAMWWRLSWNYLICLPICAIEALISGTRNRFSLRLPIACTAPSSIRCLIEQFHAKIAEAIAIRHRRFVFGVFDELAVVFCSFRSSRVSGNYWEDLRGWFWRAPRRRFRIVNQSFNSSRGPFCN